MESYHNQTDKLYVLYCGCHLILCHIYVSLYLMGLPLDLICQFIAYGAAT